MMLLIMSHLHRVLVLLISLTMFYFTLSSSTTTKYDVKFTSIIQLYGVNVAMMEEIEQQVFKEVMATTMTGISSHDIHIRMIEPGDSQQLGRQESSDIVRIEYGTEFTTTAEISIISKVKELSHESEQRFVLEGESLSSIFVEKCSKLGSNKIGPLQLSFGVPVYVSSGTTPVAGGIAVPTSLPTTFPTAAPSSEADWKQSMYVISFESSVLIRFECDISPCLGIDEMDDPSQQAFREVFASSMQNVSLDDVSIVSVLVHNSHYPTFRGVFSTQFITDDSSRIHEIIGNLTAEMNETFASATVEGEEAPSSILASTFVERSVELGSVIFALSNPTVIFSPPEVSTEYWMEEVQTFVPSSAPSVLVSHRPSNGPSGDPSNEPSNEPSSEPSRYPSGVPSSIPSGVQTVHPSGLPSNDPSGDPSGAPSNEPSGEPSSEPSSRPRSEPSVEPSSEPSCHPSGAPSVCPSSDPSNGPSGDPSNEPSNEPSSEPSCHPSGVPSSVPSGVQTVHPSRLPSNDPSGDPSSEPSCHPSGVSSYCPSSDPSNGPSGEPSNEPSSEPSRHPTRRVPSGIPSSDPSSQPSSDPSGTMPVTGGAAAPTSLSTIFPTAAPSAEADWKQSMYVISFESSVLIRFECDISPCLGIDEMDDPSQQAFREVFASSMQNVSLDDVSIVSVLVHNSHYPTFRGVFSTQFITDDSSRIHEIIGNLTAEMNETFASATVEGEEAPSSILASTFVERSVELGSVIFALSNPTVIFSPPEVSTEYGMEEVQTFVPSSAPSVLVSHRPSNGPSGDPSNEPSNEPSSEPSCHPSGVPSSVPSGVQTVHPSGLPSNDPSGDPSSEPSCHPSGVSSYCPSSDPSNGPSGEPSNEPSSEPSRHPTRSVPSGIPSSDPSSQPSSDPSGTMPVEGGAAAPTSLSTTFPTAAPSAEADWKQSMYVISFESSVLIRFECDISPCLGIDEMDDPSQQAFREVFASSMQNVSLDDVSIVSVLVHNSHYPTFRGVFSTQFITDDSSRIHEIIGNLTAEMNETFASATVEGEEAPSSILASTFVERSVELGSVIFALSNPTVIFSPPDVSTEYGMEEVQTFVPSSAPSVLVSHRPSNGPSGEPSRHPTRSVPSGIPSSYPSSQPSSDPSGTMPVEGGAAAPTSLTTIFPTAAPSAEADWKQSMYVISFESSVLIRFECDVSPCLGIDEMDDPSQQAFREVFASSMQNVSLDDVSIVSVLVHNSHYPTFRGVFSTQFITDDSSRIHEIIGNLTAEMNETFASATVEGEEAPSSILASTFVERSVELGSVIFALSNPTVIFSPPDVSTEYGMEEVQTFVPSSAPSVLVSHRPSNGPSGEPSRHPTRSVPSGIPSSYPSSQPSSDPSGAMPVEGGAAAPTSLTTIFPTAAPSAEADWKQSMYVISFESSVLIRFECDVSPCLGIDEMDDPSQQAFREVFASSMQNVSLDDVSIVSVLVHNSHYPTFRGVFSTQFITDDSSRIHEIIGNLTAEMNETFASATVEGEEAPSSILASTFVERSVELGSVIFALSNPTVIFSPPDVSTEYGMEEVQTFVPSSAPSVLVSHRPSNGPSGEPSRHPTRSVPSGIPSSYPSSQPSSDPSGAMPVEGGAAAPTSLTTIFPTAAPSAEADWKQSMYVISFESSVLIRFECDVSPCLGIDEMDDPSQQAFREVFASSMQNVSLDDVSIVSVLVHNSHYPTFRGVFSTQFITDDSSRIHEIIGNLTAEMNETFASATVEGEEAPSSILASTFVERSVELGSVIFALSNPTVIFSPPDVSTEYGMEEVQTFVPSSAPSVLVSHRPSNGPSGEPSRHPTRSVPSGIPSSYPSSQPSSDPSGAMPVEGGAAAPTSLTTIFPTAAPSAEADWKQSMYVISFESSVLIRFECDVSPCLGIDEMDDPSQQAFREVFASSMQNVSLDDVSIVSVLVHNSHYPTFRGVFSTQFITDDSSRIHEIIGNLTAEMNETFASATVEGEEAPSSILASTFVERSVELGSVIFALSNPTVIFSPPDVSTEYGMEEVQTFVPSSAPSVLVSHRPSNGPSGEPSRHPTRSVPSGIPSSYPSSQPSSDPSGAMPVEGGAAAPTSLSTIFPTAAPSAEADWKQSMYVISFESSVLIRFECDVSPCLGIDEMDDPSQQAFREVFASSMQNVSLDDVSIVSVLVHNSHYPTFRGVFSTQFITDDSSRIHEIIGNLTAEMNETFASATVEGEEAPSSILASTFVERSVELGSVIFALSNPTVIFSPPDVSTEYGMEEVQTFVPSSAPSVLVSHRPSNGPSGEPSRHPTRSVPSGIPSSYPSSQPSSDPSGAMPVEGGAAAPTSLSTIFPTAAPSAEADWKQSMYVISFESSVLIRFECDVSPCLGIDEMDDPSQQAFREVFASSMQNVSLDDVSIVSVLVHNSHYPTFRGVFSTQFITDDSSRIHEIIGNLTAEMNETFASATVEGEEAPSSILASTFVERSVELGSVIFALSNPTVIFSPPEVSTEYGMEEVQTFVPSSAPSVLVSHRPSNGPSGEPSRHPTRSVPSGIPSSYPSSQPSSDPSGAMPVEGGAAAPTSLTTIFPTAAPSAEADWKQSMYVISFESSVLIRFECDVSPCLGIDEMDDPSQQAFREVFASSMQNVSLDDVSIVSVLVHNSHYPTFRGVFSTQFITDDSSRIHEIIGNLTAEMNETFASATVEGEEAPSSILASTFVERSVELGSVIFALSNPTVIFSPPDVSTEYGMEEVQTFVPSSAPSVLVSHRPSNGPSGEPSRHPTRSVPSGIPSSYPSSQPSSDPSGAMPVEGGAAAPTSLSTIFPTAAPSAEADWKQSMYVISFESSVLIRFECDISPCLGIDEMDDPSQQAFREVFASSMQNVSLDDVSIVSVLVHNSHYPTFRGVFSTQFITDDSSRIHEIIGNLTAEMNETFASATVEGEEAPSSILASTFVERSVELGSVIFALSNPTVIFSPPEVSTEYGMEEVQTFVPSSAPSVLVSHRPSNGPSGEPSRHPTRSVPSGIPSSYPSSQPSSDPSGAMPVEGGAAAPTSLSTIFPTAAPSAEADWKQSMYVISFESSVLIRFECDISPCLGIDEMDDPSQQAFREVFASSMQNVSLDDVSIVSVLVHNSHYPTFRGVFSTQFITDDSSRIHEIIGNLTAEMNETFASATVEGEEAPSSILASTFVERSVELGSVIFALSNPTVIFSPPEVSTEYGMEEVQTFVPSSAPSVLVSHLPNNGPSGEPSSDAIDNLSLHPSYIPTQYLLLPVLGPSSRPTSSIMGEPTPHVSHAPFSPPTRQPSKLPSPCPSLLSNQSPSLLSTTTPSAVIEWMQSVFIITVAASQELFGIIASDLDDHAVTAFQEVAARSMPNVSVDDVTVLSVVDLLPTQTTLLGIVINYSTQLTAKSTHSIADIIEGISTSSEMFLEENDVGALFVEECVNVGSTTVTNETIVHYGILEVSEVYEVTEVQTGYPSSHPSHGPTSIPSPSPSQSPVTSRPTFPGDTNRPSFMPTFVPTCMPSGNPSYIPSSQPTQPTSQPTTLPTGEPSVCPSVQPTSQPSALPTSFPSATPSFAPTLSYYTLFDSSSIALPPQSGEFSFTYHVNSLSDFAEVNERWATFKDNYLDGPFELDYSIDDIWISGVSFGDVEPWVVGDMTCQETSLVTPIINSLVSGVVTNSSLLCSGTSLSVHNEGNLCINCGENNAGSTRCADPKNGTVSLPLNASCFDWESDNRITKHAVAISFSSHERVKFTVPSVEFIRLTPLTNSIVVMAGTLSSNGGMLYCKAYRPEIKDVSTITRSELRMQGFSTLIPKSEGDSPVESNVSIPELIAASTYEVYCHVEDTAGNMASLDDMFLTRTTTNTLCCRDIKFDKVSKYVTASANPENFRFQFSLPSIPESGLEVTVTPYVLHESNDYASLINILPKKFTFSTNTQSRGKSRVFALSSPLAVPSSIYSLHLNVSEHAVNSSLLRKYLPPAPRVLEVLGGSSALPPPALESAVFSSSGQSVSVCFDDATDYGANILGTLVNSKWKCSRLFSFNGDEVTSCTWSSASCVRMIPCGNTLCAQVPNRNSLNLLKPEDSLTLKDSAIKSACRAGTTCALNYYANESAIVVSAPLLPLQPSVFITASDAGGACDTPLTLDATATTGSGGRPWQSIEWSVSVPLESAEANATLTAAQLDELDTLASYLNIVGSISAPITIPFDMLNMTSYTFTLSVKNFLQSEEEYVAGSVDVFVTDAAAASSPFVFFDGPKYRIVRAFDEFSVLVSSERPSCLSSSTISYTWKVFEGTTYINVVSTSNEARRMKLAPYSLTAGETYSFSVTAQLNNGGIGKGLLTVYVEVGSAYVSIAGANSLIIPYSSPVNLDASNSVLEDLSPIDPDNVVDLVWSCTIGDVFTTDTELEFGDSCDDVFLINKSAISTYPSTELVPIHTALLQADVLYSITASAFLASDNEVTASVSIQSLPPVVVLPSIEISSTFRKFNGDEILQIFATIDSVSEARDQNVTWSLMDDIGVSINLESILLTSQVRSVQRNTTVSFPLSAKPFSFAAGKTYTFRLEAKSLEGGVSFSQISLTANGPPTSGEVEIVPSIGYSFDTRFFLTAQYWMEDASDYPILYSFRYTLQEISSNVTRFSFMNIGFTSERAFRTTQLPSGLSTRQHTVHISVSISDFYGSSTEELMNATVYDTTILASADISRRLSFSDLSSNINSAMSSGDVDAVSIEVNNIIVTLVAEDCSSVPDCTSVYNRDECFNTPHTCGECLPGYTGVVGPANSWCAPESIIPALHDLHSPCNATGNSATDPCMPPLMCLDGACALPNKACPSNSSDAICSNGGSCQFVDKFSGNVLSNCSVSDTSCAAVCSCGVGRYGSACEMTSTDYAERLETRVLLCEGLQFIGENLDESAELLSSIAAALQYAFSPFEAGSVDSILTCVNVAQIVIRMSDYGFLDNEPLFAVDGSLPPHAAMLFFSSKVLSFVQLEMLRNSTGITMQNISNIVMEMTNLQDSLMSSVSSGMVGGENEINLLSDSVLISVKYPFLDTLANASLTSPVSTGDVIYGRETAQVILPSSGMLACESFADSSSSAEFVRLSLSTWLQNPYYVDLHSALSVNTTLESQIIRFATMGYKDQSLVEELDPSNMYDTNYTLVVPLNVEWDWSNASNIIAGISAFLQDGTPVDAPCELTSVSSTALSYSCTNLLDYCPQQLAVNDNVTNRRLEMSSGNIKADSDYPAIYPDHPHYSYWSLLKMKRREIPQSRRLDFDYGVEGDDDAAGTVTYNDYGALMSSVGNENAGTFRTNPAVLHTRQGILTVSCIALAVCVLFLCLRGFIMWDIRDKVHKYKVHKKAAVVKGDSVNNLVMKSLVTLNCDSDDEIPWKLKMNVRRPSSSDDLDDSDSDMEFKDKMDWQEQDSSCRSDVYSEMSSINGSTPRKSNMHSEVSSASESTNVLFSQKSDVYSEVSSISVSATIPVDNSFENTSQSTCQSTKTKHLEQYEKAKAVRNFIASVTPPAFRATSKSGWVRFVNAICRHHNWVRCFTFPSRRLPRAIRYLVIVTDILILLFVDSLFFGILFVDDGYCESLSGEGNAEICMAKPSRMQSDISMCYFDETTYGCYLRPPPDDLTFFLIVAMLVTTLSILPSVFCETILRDVCARTPSFAVQHSAENKYIMNLGELRRGAKNTLTAYLAGAVGIFSEVHIKSEKNKDDAAICESDLRLEEINFYNEFRTLHEEVNLLTTAAKATLAYNTAVCSLPWTVGTLDLEDDLLDCARALKEYLGLYDDGSPMPMTASQQLVFRTARRKLEWKIQKVRNQAEEIMGHIDEFLKSDQGAIDNINSFLIQSFILEQMSPFRRHALREEFFHYDSASPPPVNGMLWMSCWVFLILLWIFLVYWCLLWAMENSSVTATMWMQQMIFVLIQECFVNECMQIFIVNVLVVESLRPQLKKIIDVLTGILLAKVATEKKMESERFNLAQHTSAACRAAQKPELRKLISSRLLRHINVHDIAMCREVKSEKMGMLPSLLISLPTLLAFMHESVQQCFLDVLIPSCWCFFILANSYMLMISPLLFALPYVLLFMFLLHRYGYLLPKRKRHRQYMQYVMEQMRVSDQECSHGYEVHQDSVDNMWRNMNLNLSLKEKDKSTQHLIATARFFPEPILRMQVSMKERDKYFFEKVSDDSILARMTNSLLWNLPSLKNGHTTGGEFVDVERYGEANLIMEEDVDDFEGEKAGFNGTEEFLQNFPVEENKGMCSYGRIPSEVFATGTICANEISSSHDIPFPTRSDKTNCAIGKYDSPISVCHNNLSSPAVAGKWESSLVHNKKGSMEIVNESGTSDVGSEDSIK